jgi:SpoVK/Ycf46/Vps4 family AAA+-type ATPase
MVGSDEKTNSTILNLMAGTAESGFYIIASANDPEKVNPSLIQPQRLSVLIHCGLQKVDARYEILKIHADKNSKGLEKPLFHSDEERDIILREVARLTDGFTPRYLGDITTVAKSFLIARVAAAEGRIVGLSEEDLGDHTFDISDWQQALNEVDAKYDSKKMIARDRWLADFVSKNTRSDVGFNSNHGITRKIFFWIH